MVQVFALEQDPRAAGVLGEAGRVGQRRRAARVVALQAVQLAEELVVVTRLLVGGGQLVQGGDQRLRDEPAPVAAEVPADVGLVARGGGDAVAGLDSVSRCPSLSAGRSSQVATHLGVSSRARSSLRTIGTRRVEARGHQPPHRRARVAAGHQALAAEHGVGAPAGVGEQVARAADAGLGHPQHVAGQAGGDAAEHRPVDLEGVQVAGVDPDDTGSGLQRAVGLLLGVHLDQRRHAQRLDPVEQRAQDVLLQRRDDEQHEVRAVRPRLVHLVGADDEVLAQDRDVDPGAHGGEVGQRPAEPALLGEDADHPGAALGVGDGELGGIRDRGQLTLRRAAPLHLRDDPDPGGAQRGHHVARRRGARPTGA